MLKNKTIFKGLYKKTCKCLEKTGRRPWNSPLYRYIDLIFNSNRGQLEYGNKKYNDLTWLKEIICFWPETLFDNIYKEKRYKEERKTCKCGLCRSYRRRENADNKRN
jgi:hypothetical protein